MNNTVTVGVKENCPYMIYWQLIAMNFNQGQLLL
jgi:hypothetical protein